MTKSTEVKTKKPKNGDLQNQEINHQGIDKE